MRVNFLVCVAIGCLSMMPFMVHTIPLASSEGVAKLIEETGGGSSELLPQGIAEAEDQVQLDMQMAADRSDYGGQEKEQDMTSYRGQNKEHNMQGYRGQEMDQDMKMVADKSGLVLRMFPKVLRSKPPRIASGPTQWENKWPERSTLHPLRTTDKLNFWAKPKATEGTNTTESLPRKYEGENNAAGGGGGGGGGGGDGNAVAGQKAATEMTISLPLYRTDHMGNWVFNPWGVTFGKVWEDTRFQFQGKHRIPWFYKDVAYGQYRPPNNNGKVCKGSTIYNKPRIYSWFPRYIDTSRRSSRTILVNLRTEIYNDGRSENCHTKDYDDWYKYQYCAMLRNMRMDYLVPNYPLHRWFNT